MTLGHSESGVLLKNLVARDSYQRKILIVLKIE